MWIPAQPDVRGVGAGRHVCVLLPCGLLLPAMGHVMCA